MATDNAKPLDFAQTPAPKPELIFGEAVPEPQVLDAGIVEPSGGKQPALSAQQEELALSPEEGEQVRDLARKIDLTQSAAILSYGVGAQQKMADFSQSALDNVRARDMGAIGDDLSALVVQLGELDPSKGEGGFFSIFKRGKSKAEVLKARYGTVEDSVNVIAGKLDAHQRELLKDIAMLDRMYAYNEAYSRELAMYIAAGKEKLKHVHNVELPELRAKAELSGRPDDAQAVRDLASLADRFEKRIYDLELSRQVALQTAPQIRMVQASDAVMAEKIQSTVVNTIPLWKNQMVIALGIEHAARAAAAQRQVTDMTNKLLQHNADALKQATIASARESERGVVDMETLRHTNEQLVSTITEIMQIQHEGRERRRAAEAELAGAEAQLKKKLLEAGGR